MYYLISFLFIILSGKGSFLHFYEINYLLIDILIVWVGLENDKFKKSDFIFFAKFCLIYVGFIGFRFFILNNLEFRFFVNDLQFLVKYILLSFLYCAVVKEKAIYYLTKIIMQLAMISLPLYFLQLISGDFVLALGHFFGLPPKFGKIEYTNFVVFTFDRLHSYRNSGFSWEPGAFGCFLNLGLLFYLILNNFVFDRKAWLMVLAIVTTLSTTTYAGFILIYLFYYRATGGKFIKILFLFIPVFGVLLFQVPFLIDKIVYTYHSDLEQLTRLEELSLYYLKHGGELPLNRFGSLIHIYNLFGHKLIWGICNQYQEVEAALFNVNISNGFIDFIAKFGVIGLLFLLYRFVLFLNRFSLNRESIFYCLTLIIMLSFGEPMLIFQITLALLFLYNYTNKMPLPVPTPEKLGTLNYSTVNN